MKTGRFTLAFAYLRLSNEEAQGGESSSITNQRMIVQNYCKQNNITLVREFVDDGYSGGNFNRPGFKEMLKQLEQGKANLVITKDLSRLGRDMREASYYAEQFFPEHGIQYIAIADNFDTAQDNIIAPFLFAMNEVYLRDGSRKVKDVLRNKRESGQYCACPPYGYRKDQENRHRLAPDEMTAPVVERIFRRAAAGDSSRKIALDLNADGIIPPLKYRVLYRDEFSEEGAARMLAALSGRLHLVYTGVTVSLEGKTLTQHEVTSVRFRTLTQADIIRYIATGEPMDKAGAYGIQGYGCVLVESISGDYYNVMGLPVCRLARMLTRFGVDTLALAVEKEKRE